MKVYVDWIGCRLNQSEIERIAAQFRANGHEITDSSKNADLVIVNTCAVTNSAASDSRQKIRQAWRNGGKEVIVTGCWATLDRVAASELPGVIRVLPNSEKENLVQEFLELDPAIEIYEPLFREPLPGEHRRTRAHIKVQDGCDNYCTFCITRVLRGSSRSVPFERVRKDIENAIRGGTREVVLTGVQLGSWGRDFTPCLHLHDLVDQVLGQTGISRVRLSSIEPWNLDQQFFDLWEDARLCPHIHLPLQSGSDEILKRMNRRITSEQFAEVVSWAKHASPDMAITTDIIVGFPGETQREFEKSYEFIKSLDFASGHVFTYSPRPLTPALRLDGEVPIQERKRRNAQMRKLFSEKGESFRKRFLGRELWVLWEDTREIEPGLWRLEGITGNYLRVETTSNSDLWNHESLVEIHSLIHDGVTGKILATK